MNTTVQQEFISKWNNYFPGAGLPITFYYTDQVAGQDAAESKNEHRCLIGNLNQVREGYTFVYNAKSPGCPGGKRYSGFSPSLRPNFEFFLSCGIPGKMEGERYKKTPELVQHLLQQVPPFTAPKANLVFKRWDKLEAADQPQVVLFFAPPDILSGLFTLANYDAADLYAVKTPMGSGCASIIQLPIAEAEAERPGCILGMFDVSARPCVPEDTLTFAVPMQRFVQMIDNMDESFLITGSWDVVRERLRGKV